MTKAVLHRNLLIAALMATTACSGSPTNATSPVLQAPATAAPPATLEVSSFAVGVRPRPGGVFALTGTFTLAETSGKGTATLTSVQFDAGSAVDVEDAGCWGDLAIQIPPNGTFDGQTLGYCGPFAEVMTLGDYAFLGVTYRNTDGSRATVHAIAAIPR